MGHVETERKIIFVPQTERVEQIRENLKNDFADLLSKGGVVNSNGVKLEQPCDDFINILPQDVQEQLNVKRVLRMNISKVKTSLQEKTNTQKFAGTRIYIFSPEAILGLSYSESRSGSIVPIMIGKDSSTTIPTSADSHFPVFFVNRAALILRHENIHGSHYRFATSILKEIANSSGLGNIKDAKAQSFIKRHETL